MAQFDPFETEFRQRASGMRRTPSPRAWNQLEHRLDRNARHSRISIFSIRPWMIAALLLLVAGTVALSVLSQQRTGSPLAQRAESVEDIDAAFAPADNFDVDAFRSQLRSQEPGTGASAPLPAGFRDVTVAKKYRS